MPDLSPNSVPILEGKVVLSKREGSPFWQSRFRTGNKGVRTSTNTVDLKEAKEFATNHYLDCQVKLRNDIPVVTRRFKSVAEAVRNRLQKQRDEGVGPVVNRDYIQAIDNWLIPFFGSHYIANIDHAHIKGFYEYRRKELGRDPAKTTINTHATAMRLVFDEAIAQRYVLASQVPVLRLPLTKQQKGQQKRRRPSFDIDEYRQLYRFMRGWINRGKKGKPTDMRYLLRDYVLILANSGIRHGTEAQSLRWNTIQEHQKDGHKGFLFTVDGKVRGRTAAVRYGVKRPLERIKERTHALKGLSWEETLKQDLPVFCLPDGTQTKNLYQTFDKLLRDAKLTTCPITKLKRSLYSLRHFYITQQLVANKESQITIAKNAGTNMLMIEKHYFYLDVVKAFVGLTSRASAEAEHAVIHLQVSFVRPPVTKAELWFPIATSISSLAEL